MHNQRYDIPIRRHEKAFSVSEYYAMQDICNKFGLVLVICQDYSDNMTHFSNQLISKLLVEKHGIALINCRFLSRRSLKLLSN